MVVNYVLYSHLSQNEDQVKVVGLTISKVLKCITWMKMYYTRMQSKVKEGFQGSRSLTSLTEDKNHDNILEYHPLFWFVKTHIKSIETIPALYDSFTIWPLVVMERIIILTIRQSVKQKGLISAHLNKYPQHTPYSRPIITNTALVTWRNYSRCHLDRNKL